MAKHEKLASGRVPFTWRKLVTAGALAACAPAVTATFAAPAAPQQAHSINWSLETKSGRDNSDLQLTLESRWGAGSDSIWSNGRRFDELQGLTRAELMGAPHAVRFALVKEPGRLDCTGTAGAGRGTGVCSFTPNVGFATFLDARRIGQPDTRQAFSMTMAGVGRDLVDALDDSHFQRPTVDQLTAMGIHGVTPAYVRALAGLGYRLSADELVSFRIHGVNIDEIRQFASIGPALQRLTPSDLISLRIHGVEPAYVREMAAIDPGLRTLTADDLVSMAIHGVTPALARAYVEYEGGRLSSGGLVDMAIHGVRLCAAVRGAWLPQHERRGFRVAAHSRSHAGLCPPLAAERQGAPPRRTARPAAPLGLRTALTQRQVAVGAVGQQLLSDQLYPTHRPRATVEARIQAVSVGVPNPSGGEPSRASAA